MGVHTGPGKRAHISSSMGYEVTVAATFDYYTRGLILMRAKYPCLTVRRFVDIHKYFFKFCESAFTVEG